MRRRDEPPSVLRFTASWASQGGGAGVVAGRRLGAADKEEGGRQREPRRRRRRHRRRHRRRRGGFTATRAPAPTHSPGPLGADSPPPGSNQNEGHFVH